MKAFVITGWTEHGEIFRTGEAGPVVDEFYRRVDGQGPYCIGNVFPDTTANRDRFLDFVARERARVTETGVDFHKTLNSMEKLP